MVDLLLITINVPGTADFWWGFGAGMLFLVVFFFACAMMTI